MSFLPADGQDRITPEIKEHLVAAITAVRPLSRDFSRGVNFGAGIQYDSSGEGGLLETILMRMKTDAEPESDLFYIGAVFGSLPCREAFRQ